jgi:hypothetical protein
VRLRLRSSSPLSGDQGRSRPRRHRGRLRSSRRPSSSPVHASPSSAPRGCPPRECALANSELYRHILKDRTPAAAPLLVLRTGRESRAPLCTRPRASAGVRRRLTPGPRGTGAGHSPVALRAKADRISFSGARLPQARTGERIGAHRWDVPLLENVLLTPRSCVGTFSRVAILGERASEKRATATKKAVETPEGGRNRPRTTNATRHRRAASRRIGVQRLRQRQRQVQRQWTARGPKQSRSPDTAIGHGHRPRCRPRTRPKRRTATRCAKTGTGALPLTLVLPDRRVFRVSFCRAHESAVSKEGLRDCGPPLEPQSMETEGRCFRHPYRSCECCTVRIAGACFPTR